MVGCVTLVTLKQRIQMHWKRTNGLTTRENLSANNVPTRRPTETTSTDMNWFILRSSIIFASSATSKQKLHNLWKSIWTTIRVQNISVTKSYNSANFSTHKKTKHGNVEHKCDLCGENFQYLRHLVRHQDNHQNLKSNCKLCEKQFSREYILREHERKEHGLEQPGVFQVKENKIIVSCSECGKHFTQSKHLTRHKATVHGGESFPCDNCQKNFSRRDKLNAHKKNICPSNNSSNIQ